MNRILYFSVVMLVAAGVARAGEIYGHALPGSGQSQVVVPSRQIGPVAYVSGTNYVQGQYVLAGSRAYMLVTTNAYNATNSPSHLSGDAITNDGYSWRRIPTSSRQGVTVVLQSGGPVWGREGPGAVTNAGFLLTGAGSTLVYSGQSELSFSSVSAAYLSVGENNQ